MTARRIANYHTSKRKVLGGQPKPSPAWKDQPKSVNGVAVAVNGNSPQGKTKPANAGSKILVSNMPPDVTEEEVVNLFKKMVGPLRDAFLAYDATGISRGQAVVSFINPDDALKAKQQWNGKLIDKKHTLRIEVVDVKGTIKSSASAGASSSPVKPATLLSRLAPPSSTKAGGATSKQQVTVTAPGKAVSAPQGKQSSQKPAKRVKKGPKRVKKAGHYHRPSLSAEQLDQEMDNYRASAAS